MPKGHTWEQHTSSLSPSRTFTGAPSPLPAQFRHAVPSVGGEKFCCQVCTGSDGPASSLPVWLGRSSLQPVSRRALCLFSVGRQLELHRTFVLNQLLAVLPEQWRNMRPQPCLLRVQQAGSSWGIPRDKSGFMTRQTALAVALLVAWSGSCVLAAQLPRASVHGSQKTQLSCGRGSCSKNSLPRRGDMVLRGGSRDSEGEHSSDEQARVGESSAHGSRFHSELSAGENAVLEAMKALSLDDQVSPDCTSQHLSHWGHRVRQLAFMPLHTPALNPLMRRGACRNAPSTESSKRRRPLRAGSRHREPAPCCALSRALQADA